MPDHGFDIALRVSGELEIPAWELEEQFIRASGPGGQNVNKVATAVQLRWNVQNSSLCAAAKAKIMRHWAARLTSDGDLIVQASTYRTQGQNRHEARRRLVGLVQQALIVRKRRIPTRPGRGAVERRISAKKKRADIKGARQKPRLDD